MVLTVRYSWWTRFSLVLAHHGNQSLGADVFFLYINFFVVMDAGESNGEGFARALTENSGQRTNGVQLARKYKGLVIAWEHRYYGGSIPFVQVRPCLFDNGPCAHRLTYTFRSE
jgi:hypothetical protein